jgi:Putative MetA-pathway of phenol degradation
MKKIFIIVVMIFTITKTFSQCACCAGAGIGSTNGDYNNGILTLPKKTILIEAYSDYRTIKDGNAPEEDEKLLTKMLINSFGIRYGLTKNISVSLLLPYVSLYTNNGSDSGLGDLILLGTYNIYSKNKLNFAIQGGIELPTGEQKNSSFDNTTVIVGSGSYDPMAGILFSKQWNKLTLNGNVFYKYTTNGFQGNYYGSLSVHGLGVSYKIKGESSICEMDSLKSKKAKNFGISGNIGYSGEWLDKLKEEEVVDEDSGHYLGLANFGGTFLYKKWAFPFTLSLPIINEMNGLQNDFGYRFRVGIIRAF